MTSEKKAKLSPALESQLRKFLADWVQDQPGEPGPVPGAGVAVFADGEPALSLTAGFSNPTDKAVPLAKLAGPGNIAYSSIPPQRRVAPGDLFEIGSLSKNLTASLLLKYVENGSISLSDPLSDWLPEYCLCPAVNGAATIEQLLNMTAGIPDFEDDLDYCILPKANSADGFHKLLNEDNPGKFWMPNYVLRHLNNGSPMFPPGTDWAYSTTNYVLLGLILNDLVNYFDLTHALGDLTSLAGIETQVFLGAYQEIDESTRVLGWNKSRPGIERRGFLTSYWTGGGYLSHAGAMARWIYLLNQPGRVLPNESLAAMKSFYRFKKPLDLEHLPGLIWDSYGLGLMHMVVTSKDGSRTPIIGHMGESRCFQSAAMYMAEKNLGFAITINKRNMGAILKMTRDLTRILQAQ